MEVALTELETCFQSQEDADFLVRAELTHYQFETIHPFLDGKGRIGRMLIVLFLMNRKILEFPSFLCLYFLKATNANTTIG